VSNPFREFFRATLLPAAARSFGASRLPPVCPAEQDYSPPINGVKRIFLRCRELALLPEFETGVAALADLEDLVFEIFGGDREPLVADDLTPESDGPALYEAAGFAVGVGEAR
jgi:hypothetical protein